MGGEVVRNVISSKHNMKNYTIAECSCISFGLGVAFLNGAHVLHVSSPNYVLMGLHYFIWAKSITLKLISRTTVIHSYIAFLNIFYFGPISFFNEGVFSKVYKIKLSRYSLYHTFPTLEKYMNKINAVNTSFHKMSMF